MRFEPRHAFLASWLPAQGRESRRATPVPAAADLPIEIAFLADYRVVDDAILRAAADMARRHKICAAALLIAEGEIDPSRYYRALAYHLGLAFVDDWPDIARTTDVAAAHRTGCVRLAARDRPLWLVAPRTAVLRTLLLARRIGLPDLAITTPAHFAAVISRRAQSKIEQIASEALPSTAPTLSAKNAVDAWVGGAAGLLIVCGALALAVAPRLSSDLAGLLFFASMSFRLGVSAEGLVPEAAPVARLLADVDLPTYTILVPLRQEAELVADLLAALNALDYPRAKLEVFLLVEPEDLSTRAALDLAQVPPWLQVVVAPMGGGLRTKPRALNIGLMMARGTLLTVYDAEDRPASDQLRYAASIFEAAPNDFACLQARLSIDNGRKSLLARLFAIEYSALFDVFNIGAAALDLPMALGGTSNHFRTSILRAVGGWDAWNVTEDADLGLRLARFGYRVGCFASTTMEAAPDLVRVWMKQRRRWTKGWMQTFLVLMREAPGLTCKLGWKRSGALALLFVNLVAGPLLFPVFCGLVVLHLVTAGPPKPHGTLESIEATLNVCVLGLGLASTLWCGYAGLRARRLRQFLPSLPLLVPYQLMISAAAWLGFIDLILNPHHWHKTVHRAAVRRGVTSPLADPSRHQSRPSSL